MDLVTDPTTRLAIGSEPVVFSKRRPLVAAARYRLYPRFSGDHPGTLRSADRDGVRHPKTRFSVGSRSHRAAILQSGILKREAVKTLSICIPTYRRPALLERCVRSVISSAADRPIEIVVADDSVSDINAGRR